jgi:hypothetical protein
MHVKKKSGGAPTGQDLTSQFLCRTWLCSPRFRSLHIFYRRIDDLMLKQRK